MSDNKTGFEKLDDLVDEDGNIVTEFDGNVETPTEEELEERSVVELKEKYGPFADMYLLDDGEDSI